MTRTKKAGIEPLARGMKLGVVIITFSRRVRHGVRKQTGDQQPVSIQPHNRFGTSYISTTWKYLQWSSVPIKLFISC